MHLAASETGACNVNLHAAYSLFIGRIYHCAGDREQTQAVGSIGKSKETAGGRKDGKGSISTYLADSTHTNTHTRHRQREIENLVKTHSQIARQRDR